MGEVLETPNPYPLPIKIAGIGRYLPPRVVSSKELEADHGLEPGWCEKNTGIYERRWVEEETPSFMGAEAAREAVANAGMNLEDIDLIISASSTADFERGIPDGGPLVQEKLGLADSGIPGFTMQAGGLSFMLALDNCAALLTTGRFHNILVVSSEIFSLNLDPHNPHVYGLFGDGAAAALVTRTPEGENSTLDQARFKNYSHAADAMYSLLGLTVVKNTGKSSGTVDITLHLEAEAFQANGNKYLQEILGELLNKTGTTIQDFKTIIPPQAGKSFLHHLRDTLHLDEGKASTIFDRLGYCGAASIPMALYEALHRQKLTRGTRVLVLDVGAGISVGGMMITY
jgi:3-oxoacyl-[acyl-carrier-protein] synthase-3